MDYQKAKDSFNEMIEIGGVFSSKFFADLIGGEKVNNVSSFLKRLEFNKCVEKSDKKIHGKTAWVKISNADKLKIQPKKRNIKITFDEVIENLRRIYREKNREISERDNKIKEMGKELGDLTQELTDTNEYNTKLKERLCNRNK